MYSTILIGYDGDEASRDAFTLARLLSGSENDTRLVPANVSPGSARRDLRALAEEVGADLVVVGSSREGALGRVLPGDSATALLHDAPCAVVIVPTGFQAREQRFLRVIG